MGKSSEKDKLKDDSDKGKKQNQSKGNQGKSEPQPQYKGDYQHHKNTTCNLMTTKENESFLSKIFLALKLFMISTVFYQFTVLSKYHILINRLLFPAQLPTLVDFFLQSGSF